MAWTRIVAGELVERKDILGGVKQRDLLVDWMCLGVERGGE